MFFHPVLKVYFNFFFAASVLESGNVHAPIDEAQVLKVQDISYCDF